MAKKKVPAKSSHSIKKDGYEIHYGHEIQDMMEKHMYRGAGRRHPSDDLNNGEVKPAGEPFYEAAKMDSKRAYRRAGLGPKSGADNDKESMEYAKEVGVCKKKRK